MDRDIRELLVAQRKFMLNYCFQKDWPLSARELTIEQIIEICSQEEYPRVWGEPC